MAQVLMLNPHKVKTGDTVYVLITRLNMNVAPAARVADVSAPFIRIQPCEVVEKNEHILQVGLGRKKRRFKFKLVPLDHQVDFDTMYIQTPVPMFNSMEDATDFLRKTADSFLHGHKEHMKRQDQLEGILYETEKDTEESEEKKS